MNIVYGVIHKYIYIIIMALKIEGMRRRWWGVWVLKRDYFLCDPGCTSCRAAVHTQRLQTVIVGSIDDIGRKALRQPCRGGRVCA